jgi:antitoxin component YwqK of YwqJK toxin-antitoxin module
MKRNIEIEISLFERCWDLNGLIVGNITGKLIKNSFYINNSNDKDTIELLWENKDKHIIGYEEYIKLKEDRILYCEFYEWIGFSIDGKLQGYFQQWNRNGNKKFESNYVDGKRHGDFTTFKENGEEEFYGVSGNGDLLETNYGF